MPVPDHLTTVACLEKRTILGTNLIQVFITGIAALSTLTVNVCEVIADADSLRAIFTDKTASGKHLKYDGPENDVYFAVDCNKLSTWPLDIRN